MFRIKYNTNLLKYIFVATILLAALTCSASALDVVDDLSGMLVTVNDGRPLPVTNGVVVGSQIGIPATLDISSIDLYIPFVAPSDNIIARLSLLCSTADLHVSGSVQAGAFGSGIFYPHYDLSCTEWDYGYSTVESTALTNTGYQVDTSPVPAADFAWYVHIRLAGSATLVLYSLNDSYLVGSQGGKNVVVSNDDSSVSLTQRNGSFTLHDFSIYSSSGLYKSYYEAGKYVQVALSGLVFKASAGQTVTLSNGDISGTVKNKNSHFTTPSETITSHGAVKYAADTIRLSASRNDDDAEAVAELQKMNATLDGMATNLQTITDDFTAREDVGTDISGTTTDDQIANGNAGMATGSGSLSSAIGSLPSFSSIIAPTSSFISFLTVPISQIFEFGGGYLLYIATVMVLCSVLFWVIKKMGGDS